MAVSKAQQKAVNKYMAANYDRINLTVAKGQQEIIKAHAESQGESVNGFINRAIDQVMEQDRRRGPQEATESTEGTGAVLSPSEREETAQNGVTAKED